MKEQGLRLLFDILESFVTANIIDADQKDAVIELLSPTTDEAVIEEKEIIKDDKGFLSDSDEAAKKMDVRPKKALHDNHKEDASNLIEVADISGYPPNVLEKTKFGYLYSSRLPIRCIDCKNHLISKVIHYDIPTTYDNCYNKKTTIYYCKQCKRWYVRKNRFNKEAALRAFMEKDTLSERDFFVENTAAKKDVAQPEKSSAVVSNQPISKERTPANDKDRVIGITDLLLKRSTLCCLHSQHTLIDLHVKAQVVTKNGTIDTITVPVGYCEECDLLFIMKDVLTQVKKRGTLLCRVMDLRTYRESNGWSSTTNFSESSILMQYGYNVNAQQDLAPIERRCILAKLMDEKILSRGDILSYLNSFINLRQSNGIMESAISKWEDDIYFVTRYKIGSYKDKGKAGLNLKLQY